MYAYMCSEAVCESVSVKAGGNYCDEGMRP